MNLAATAACLLVALPTAVTSLAADYRPGTEISIGSEYTEGSYGATTRTRVLESFVGVRHESERQILTVTLHQLRITSGADVVVSEGAVVPSGAPPAGATTETGVGDTVIGWTWKTPWLAGTDWLVDVGARAKLATADADRGLGTGRNDYSVLSSIAHNVGPWLLRVETGYRFRGQPKTFQVKNGAFGAIGADYRFNARLTADVYLDAREPAAPGSLSQAELSVGVRYRWEGGRSIGIHAIKGLTEASPSVGIGVKMAYRW